MALDLTHESGYIQTTTTGTTAAVPLRRITTVRPLVLYLKGEFTVRGDTIAVQIDPKSDYLIQADTVHVSGDISLPGRTVSIVANEVLPLGDAASIDVSGSPPTAPVPMVQWVDNPVAEKGRDARQTGDTGLHGENGQVGGHGKNGEQGTTGAAGGQLTVFAQRIGAVTFKADGGAGSSGQDGQDGQAGGDGGLGLIFRTYEPGPIGRVVTSSPRTLSPGVGGIGGNAGLGGRGGPGGPGGTVLLYWVETAGDARVRAAGGAAGEDGRNGTPGHGGLIHLMSAEPSAVLRSLPGKVPDRDANDRAPKSGAAGTARGEHLRMAELDAHRSVSFLQMQVDRVWQLAIEESIERPGPALDGLMASIHNVLTRLVADAGFPRRPEQEQRDLRDLLATTGRLNAFRALGLDAFGYRLHYAPNLTLKFHASEAERRLRELATVEERSESLFKDFQPASLVEARRQLRLDGQRVLQETLGRELQAQRTRVDKTVKELRTVFAEFAAARAAAFSPERSDELQREIQAQHGAFELSALLEALTMCLFVPPSHTEQSAAGAAVSSVSPAGAVMLSAQMVSFLASSANKIRGADGEVLEKSGVLRSIQAIRVQHPRDLLSNVRIAPGGGLSDMGIDGLLVAAADLRRAIDPIRNLRAAARLLGLLEVFEQALQRRAEVLGVYNIQLAHWLDLRLQLDALNQAEHVTVSEIADDAAAAQETALLVAQFQRIHRHAAHDCVAQLWLANRAYRAWRLVDPDDTTSPDFHGTNVFETLAQERGPGRLPFNHASLTRALETLRSWYIRDLASFTSEVAQSPKDPNTDGLILRFGRASKVLDELQQARPFPGVPGRLVHWTRFRISPSAHDVRGATLPDELRGYANVRLFALRCILNGQLGLSSGTRVVVRIGRSTEEENITTDGRTVQFHREPIELLDFTFDPSVHRTLRSSPGVFNPAFIQSQPRFITGVNHSGDGAHDEQELGYAGLSPFSTWTVIVDPALNHTLDVRRVDELEFQLLIIGRAMLPKEEP